MRSMCRYKGFELGCGGGGEGEGVKWWGGGYVMLERERDSFHLVTTVHLLENVCWTNINTEFSPLLPFVAEFTWTKRLF